MSGPLPGGDEFAWPAGAAVLIGKALNLVRGVVTIKDRHLRYRLVNDRLLDHWGLPREAVIGRTRRELFPDHPETPDEIADHQILNGVGPINLFETQIVAGSGVGRPPMWVRGIQTLLPGQNGGEDFVFSIGIDVTDLRDAREALAESAGRDAAVVSMALDCIITISAHGEVLEFNPAAEKTFAWTRAEVVGRPIHELIIPPRHRQNHHNAMERVLKTGETRIMGQRVEIEALRADGTEIPVELAIVQVNRDGRPAYTAFLRDLTQRREAEAKLRAVEHDRSQLARFFAPAIVEELLSLKTPLTTARNQDAAVLFADMIGFTTRCSVISPEEVMTLLRSWHSALSAEIFRHNGTLDKFLGDGLMATFGMPTPSEDDANASVRCAIDMVEAVAAMNVERLAAGADELNLAVGIHYGPIVVGDIGDMNRLELTVVGDTVNVASRIEGLCRRFGTSIVITAATIARMRATGGDDLAARFEDLGNQVVRGRQDPVHLFRFRP